MRSIKKIVAMSLSIIMVLGLITVTNVSAADGDILYEDFGTGFTIGTDSIESSSGFTVTAGADAYNGYLVHDTAAGTVEINGSQSNVAYDASLFFDFADITAESGKTYISFTMKPGNYWNNSTTLSHAYPFFAIGNQNITSNSTISGNAVTALQQRYYLEDEKITSGKYMKDIKSGQIYHVPNTDFHKIEYIIDIANQKYDVAVDGVWTEGIDFYSPLTTINRIAFPQGGRFWENCDVYLSDVKLVRNIDANTYAVTFMNGDEVWSSQSVMATFDASLPETNPSQNGKNFAGWVDSEGNVITSADLTDIRANATYYASYSELIAYKETFGSDFRIDYENAKIYPDTGFEMSAAAAAFGLPNEMKKTDDETLYLNGRNGNSAAYDTNFYFDIDPISEGTVKVAFDIRITNWCPNGGNWRKTFFAIGNDSITNSNNVSGNSIASLTTAYNNSGTYVKGITIESTNTLLAEADTSKWYNVEYTIDMAGTYDVAIDGTTVAEDVKFDSTLDSISRIAFTQDPNTQYHNIAEYIDNVTIIQNPDNQNYAVKFMNGEEVYNTQTVAVFGDAAMPEGEPAVSGKLFSGWVTADGSAVTEDMLKEVKADATYYASFRDLLALKETFDSVTIDYTNGSISKNSGFDLSAAADAYTLPDQFKVENGALKLMGMVYNSAVYNTNFYMDFPAVTSGTVKIAFDINPISYGVSTGHNGPIFGIGNSSMIDGGSVSANSISYAENGNSTLATKGIFLNDGTQLKDKTTGSWVTIEYIITMPEGETVGSYDVYVDGTLVAENKAFTNELKSIDRIIFSQRTDGEAKFRNSNNYIDNVTVIENPENNTKTVTFMNGEEVYNTQTVAVFGDAVMPESEPTVSGKVFTGWRTADGADLTEDMLLNVTENATYYADFRDLVNITETFGDNFKIDYDAKTMTSDSGLKFSTTKEGTYDSTNGLKINSYGLAAPLNNGATVDSDVYIKFPNITSGKVYIAFDLRNHHSSINHTKDKTFFGIGDSETSAWATTLTTVDLSQFKTEDGTVVSEGTIEYVIDLDNNTYTIKSGGALVGETHTLKETERFDSIYLASCVNGAWYSVPFSIDNITIIEDYEEPTPEIPDTIEGELDATGYSEKVLASGKTVTINGTLKNGIIDARLGSVVMGTTTLTGRITFNADGDVDAAVGDTVKLQTTLTEDFIYGGKNYGQGVMNGFIQKTPITATTTKYTMILTANGMDDKGNTYTDTKVEVPFEIKNNTFEGDARFRALVTGVPEGITITAAYGETE